MMLKSLVVFFLMTVMVIGLWCGNIPSASASIFSLAGDRPMNLGVRDGQFAPCAATPNCVSSQATDAEHRIDGISYSVSATQVWAELQQVVANLPNTKIVSSTENYLYAEFTSHLMGFVDDVEFYLTPGVIQVRSASRLGESDLGVNRKRIETIRAQLQTSAQ